jgi:hypothetical protein
MIVTKSKPRWILPTVRDLAAVREAEDGPSRPIATLQYFGRYWVHIGHQPEQ